MEFSGSVRVMYLSENFSSKSNKRRIKVEFSVPVKSYVFEWKLGSKLDFKVELMWS